MATAVALACGRGDERESRQVSAVTATCASTTVKILDLHADFRDIWKGLETTETGKEADPRPLVGIDFNTTVQPASVVGQFAPVKTDGTCGPTVPSALAASVLASTVWGSAGSNAARPAVPGPYNVFTRDGITGIVSAAGAVAAGGDVTLSNVGVNATAHQTVGLVAGGKVTLANGSIFGNVSYGVASTIPGSVSVSGTKTLQPFAVASAFQDLSSLSVLLAQMTPTGTANFANGTLQLTGTSSAVNVFQISADTLAQASNVVLTVPANAGTLINVTGNMGVAFVNKGFTLSGATAANTLWNIAAAPFVQIANVGLTGSLLAPRALVSFDSGTLNGTLVAASFASLGTGMLQHAPLNVAKLFGPNTPSLVRLTPAQPLVRGCTYQFTLPGTVPLTSGNACLSPPLSVTFRVATSAAPPAGRELVSTEPDFALRTLRRFTARPGVNTAVGDIWSRYESAIGVPASTLVPTTSSAPSATRPGQTITVYQQYAQTYPVVGHGYFVATEGNAFRAANGKVMPGLPSFPPAAVTASTALQNALTFLKITGSPPWVTKPNLYKAPVGRLVVTPAKLAAKAADFVLAWEFPFGASAGVSHTGMVQVNAATGVVVGASKGNVALTTLNASATYVSQGSATVDSPTDGAGKTISSAIYRNPDASTVATLATGDIKANGVAATVTGLTEDALANFVGTAQYVLDPTPLTPWTTTEPTEQRMASAQWALQLSSEFLKSLGLNVNGTPWVNLDGPVAKQKAFVDYIAAAPATGVNPVHYSYTNSTADAAHIVVYYDGAVLPVQLTTIGHEYAHALVQSLRRAANLQGPSGLGTIDTFNEAGSVGEGVADLFAITLKHKTPGASGPWYCLQFDKGSGPQCHRNIADPGLSFDDPLKNGIPGLPVLYKDVGNLYGDFAAYAPGACDWTNDDCGAHLNSTIVSHWGYLLGVGSAGLANVPCSLVIEPLDADVDKSMQLVLKIALVANGTRTSPSAKFAEFRDATLQVAEEMIAQGTLPASALPKIELAWAAVGLPPAVSHPAKASPAGGASINPWAKFVWASAGDGQTAPSWDFQLANGPFETNLLFHKDDIVDDINDQGTLDTTELPLSLPYNTTDAYFWRVRPHSSLPWESCYPIRSFVGTSEPDVVSRMKITKNLAEDGVSILPGQFYASWEAVRGTLFPNYEVYVAPTDAQCTDGDEVERPPASNGKLETDGVTWNEFSGIITQPKTHYYMSVRPVGPPDFAGVQPRGACKTLEFDTAQLLPPVTGPDSIGRPYGQPWLAGFNWTVTGGAVNSLISMYLRDENGDCAATPIAPPSEFATSCLGDCPVSTILPAFPDAPNPTGYCWDIVTVAKNGEKSPPSEKKIITFRAFTLNESPGVFWEQVMMGPSGTSVGALAGDSYGKDIRFSWTTTPNYTEAPAYGFKLGRWMWEASRNSPEPANCVDNSVNINICLNDPSADTKVLEEVHGTPEVTIPGDKAAHGRYCWSVWPVFDVESHAGPRREPEVSASLTCYTTGPADPEYDLPPDYTPGTYKGSITFPYVPDGQATIDFTLPDGRMIHEEMTSYCAAAGPKFADLYDCVYPLKVTFPDPGGQKFEMHIQTWNSDTFPAVRSDEIRVHDITREVEVPHCGNNKEKCCEKSPDACSSSKLVCTAAKRCLKCGAVGSACCANDQCADSGHCKSGNCLACGGLGEACCENSRAACGAGTHCLGGVCVESCLSPPVVPSVPFCIPLGDTVGAHFQVVGGATGYEVEYTYPGGTYSKTYDDATLTEDPNVDAQGNYINPSPWRVPPNEPSVSGGVVSYRVRALGSCGASEWSNTSTVDATDLPASNSASCVLRGWCVYPYICTYKGPPS